jgi:hypothetical protein
MIAQCPQPEKQQRYQTPLYIGGWGVWQSNKNSCDFLNALNMHSQPHPSGFNIESCMTCEEKLVSHNQTDQEKQRKNKTKPASQTEL